MKIEIEIKDNPRGRPTVRVNADQSVHVGLQHMTPRILSAMVKKQYPWVKIIDLRIDLR